MAINHACLQTERFKNIEDDVKEMKCSLYGNGKPGLVIEVHDLKSYINAEKNARENRSTRNWAVIMLIATNIMFFIRDMVKEFFQ